jgi:hypothetical protein
VEIQVWAGAIVLTDASTRVKLRFDFCTLEQYLELVRFFRTVLAGRTQEEWERFESRMPVPLDIHESKKWLGARLRFISIAGAVGALAMFGILCWSKLNGGMAHISWLGATIIPLGFSGMIVVPFWFAWRAVCREAAKAETGTTSEKG